MNLDQQVKEKFGRRNFEWIHNLDSLHTDTICSIYHYLLLLEQQLGWALSLLPCSFLFDLHLESCLNTSTDKKSNAVCKSANFCSTLVHVSSFHQPIYFLSTFSRANLLSVEMHKRKRKKVNREKIKCI